MSLPCRFLIVWLIFGDTLRSKSISWGGETSHQQPSTQSCCYINRQVLPFFAAAELQAYDAQTPTSGAKDILFPSNVPASNTKSVPEEESAARSVQVAREFLRNGSYHEALAVLKRVPASKQDEPIILLLLAEAYANLGQVERDMALLNRLLGIGQLADEARSFILNRKGLCLQSTGDFEGARESYELAVAGGQDNRHALYNLAFLLHYNIFPETRFNASVLFRAITLYRKALGRDTTILALQQEHNPMVTTLAATDLRATQGGSEPGSNLAVDPGPDPGGSRQPNRNQQKELRVAARQNLQKHGDGIGGPIDHANVSKHLAKALVQDGRPGEAVAELEDALAQMMETDRGEKWAREMAFLWGSISDARFSAGDTSGAVTAGRTAVELVGDEPALHCQLGIVLQKIGLMVEAEEAWRIAVALDPNLVPALTSLGNLEGARGNIERARGFYEASLSFLLSKKKTDSSGPGHNAIASSSDVLNSKFLVATAVIPAVYDSNDHIAQVRADFENGLDRLLAEPSTSASMVLKAPLYTVGSGSLGYYIIYQGFEDLGLRRKLARAYWKFAPSLRYCADFLLASDETSEEQPTRDYGPLITPESLPVSKPAGAIVRDLLRATSRDEAGGGEMSKGLGQVKPLIGEPSNLFGEEIERGKQSFPNGMAPTAAVENTASAGETNQDTEKVGSEKLTTPCRQRRLRVGFLSAYFFHHSVGLLTEGVVTGLDRRRFETIAIFLQPGFPSVYHGTNGSASDEGGGGGGGGDRVYETIRSGTERLLDLPANSPVACYRAIASLELDVLVFTEIGMNLETYFLSFARLARRSALFWGHAVTSGISAFDALYTGNGDGLDDGAGSRGCALDPREVGGIDYFVSSWLFEDKDLGRLAQRKYSERLYLMRGLTTRFKRPPPPEPGLVTRKLLGIPTAAASSVGREAFPLRSATKVGAATSQPRGSEGTSQAPASCRALYLVPQTLCKIHPDFDRLVIGVLNADLSGCVIFIRAFQEAMTESLVRRITRTFGAAGVGAGRVIFLRSLGLAEFLALVEMADVVLDPFPVGGGRSSLEVLAVGTPIVMLYNRTSILQLTYGMYAIMGLEGPIFDTHGSSPPVSLVTYSEHQFIHSAIEIATNTELNARTRQLILANNDMLYEQDSVVEEWEGFLERIVSNPRPPPVKRHGLAVDASNFTTSPRCSISPSSGSSGYGNGGDRTVESPTQVTALDEMGNGTLEDVIRGEVGKVDPFPGSSTGLTDTVNALGGAVGEDTSVFRSTNTSGQQGQRNAVLGVGVGTHPVVGIPRREVSLPAAVNNSTLEAGDHWRAIDGSDGVKTVDGAVSKPSDLLYAVEFSLKPTHEGGSTRVHLIEIYEGTDPMEEAKNLKEEEALDFCQYRWVGVVLCRGLRRLNRPIVWSSLVDIDDGPRHLLEVHQGDDLYQVARWHCHRHSLGGQGVQVLRAQLEKELPQHTEPQWILNRSEDRDCFIPPTPSTNVDYTSLDPNSSVPHTGTTFSISERMTSDSGFTGAIESFGGILEDDGCITLAITTCKRLRAFFGTVQGLQAMLGPLPHQDGSSNPAFSEGEDGVAVPRVCHVLVVDDGSSPEDRRLMMLTFPRFTYVFKGVGDKKGHAGSMNLILSLTKTRYLLYIEDDWWTIREKLMSSTPGANDVLWRAMQVLKSSTERVSQVLINDQSSRSCAWGDTAACPTELQGTSSGWKRFTSVPDQEQVIDAAIPGEIRSDQLSDIAPLVPGAGKVCRSGRCDSRGPDSRGNSTDEVERAPGGSSSSRSKNAVEYRLHEFGLMIPSHDFTYWPGFSLNPALWDLRRIGDSYRRKHGRRFQFDPDDTRFEQTVSMEIFDAGITVAHLPDITFWHIGGGQSAYEANGMQRPWDRPSTSSSGFSTVRGTSY